MYAFQSLIGHSVTKKEQNLRAGFKMLSSVVIFVPSFLPAVDPHCALSTPQRFHTLDPRLWGYPREPMRINRQTWLQQLQ